MDANNGCLESRVLDFETVIITSVNEGKFPAGKKDIVYSLWCKRELGLPTYKEKMLFIRITFIIYYKEPKCFPNL
jgi:inactivated superfamily I helicase